VALSFCYTVLTLHTPTLHTLHTLRGHAFGLEPQTVYTLNTCCMQQRASCACTPPPPQRTARLGMFLLLCRRIQYTVIAQSVGVKPNTVVLGNRDGTESNNRANWTVTVSPTCAFPESLTATRPNCSDTSAYNTSRDNVVLPLCGNVVCANAFQDNCCVSAVLSQGATVR
jgi:hypothetical protein